MPLARAGVWALRSFAAGVDGIVLAGLRRSRFDELYAGDCASTLPVPARRAPDRNRADRPVDGALDPHKAQDPDVREYAPSMISAGESDQEHRRADLGDLQMDESEFSA